MHSLLSQFRHFSVRGSVAVMLAALALSSAASGEDIWDAAMHGDLTSIKELLKANPNLVSSHSSNGQETPLHAAAYADHRDVMELLLAYKADVDARNYEGRTPLHQAAYLGHKKVAELLLANKADVNARDNNGMTPLHLAAWRGGKDVAELLLAQGADVNAKDKNGRTPLYNSSETGSTSLAALLLANKADVNTKDNYGNTSLQWALSAGHKEVAELIRGQGGREMPEKTVAFEFLYRLQKNPIVWMLLVLSVVKVLMITCFRAIQNRKVRIFTGVSAIVFAILLMFIGRILFTFWLLKPLNHPGASHRFDGMDQNPVFAGISLFLAAAGGFLGGIFGRTLGSFLVRGPMTPSKRHE